jgi:O-methyltransferase
MELWSDVESSSYETDVMRYAFNDRVTLASFRSLLGRALIRAAKVVGGNASAIAPKPWVQLPFDPETQILWDRVRSRTMTSIERIDALRASVEYVHENSISGDIVECGVWRGGSMMAVALTLLRLGGNRRLWLYDTFSGMTPPGSEDKDFQGRWAKELLAAEDPHNSLIWGTASLEEVQAALAGTGYPGEQIEFVVGPVENTIPGKAPESIALLRLDTDWFQSTSHELVHLWPRITEGGILIIDDYGDWVGAKRAVDEYFARIRPRPLLHRIDGTGRLVMKQHQSSYQLKHLCR